MINFKTLTFDIFVYSILIILGVVLIIFSFDIINLFQLEAILIGFFGLILCIIGFMCIIEDIKKC